MYATILKLRARKHTYTHTHSKWKHKYCFHNVNNRYHKKTCKYES